VSRNRSVATVNAFLRDHVVLFALLGQAHGELESEDRGYRCRSFAPLDLPLDDSVGALTSPLELKSSGVPDTLH